jgi:hypothetical protein
MRANFVLILSAVTAVFAARCCEAADWQQSLSPVSAGHFPAIRPHTATYRFGWTKFDAAEAIVIFSERKGTVQLDVEGRTSGFVRTLWRLDVHHHAAANATSLQPLEMQQRETYRDKTINTELAFSRQTVTKLRETKPDDKVTPARKRFTYPNLLDLHTAYLFVRSQPLEIGEMYRFVSYPATAPYLASVRVVGREKLRVPAGTCNAIKLEIKLQKINRQFALEAHTKFKRGYVWISDDPDRIVLKVAADIFVGSVWAELWQIKFRGN